MLKNCNGSDFVMKELFQKSCKDYPNETGKQRHREVKDEMGSWNRLIRNTTTNMNRTAMKKIRRRKKVDLEDDDKVNVPKRKLERKLAVKKKMKIMSL